MSQALDSWGRLPVARRFRVALAPLLLALAAPAMARGDSTTIDFETIPNLVTQPSTFAAVGNAQTINVPGIATISGGAVLGDPTGLSAFPSQGSLHNAYGTSAFASGSGYSQSITIDFSSGINVSSVTAVLFNGETDVETYTVNAYSGATLVDQNVFTDVPDTSLTTSYANVSFSSASNPITQVVFTPTGSFASSSYDFFVDTIGVTYQVQTVPEPGSLLLLGLGTLSVVLGRRTLARRP